MSTYSTELPSWWGCNCNWDSPKRRLCWSVQYVTAVTPMTNNTYERKWNFLRNHEISSWNCVAHLFKRLSKSSKFERSSGHLIVDSTHWLFMTWPPDLSSRQPSLKGVHCVFDQPPTRVPKSGRYGKQILCYFFRVVLNFEPCKKRHHWVIRIWNKKHLTKFH